MRYLILFLFSMVLSQTAQSQIYEIGGFAGGSNFIGDVGATNYISPNSPALGLILKWNRSPRHSWRVSIIYADLEGKDSKSDDPRRVERGYSFDTSLLEISAGMEFTFFDFNLHGNGNKSTPYLYTGITAAKHDNYFFSSTGRYTSEDTNSWAFGIPMVLGFKTTITNHIILGAEIGARYTFSDEIDGSVPDAEFRESLSFGNTNSNDWYVFSGFTLTYTFGKKPCYCNF
ncbi:type IX secretion system protein PorG [Ichthyenterobacterium magnum]|uniref:DUF6089 domain-containing protein n=1 Tax=Ichthyenterobacterium magnum TaxID=1230530 RepID=A0A420DFN1_9FLAO|nr:DUF6089 family protein [Ichthyenterobacterium magnum]RKE91884.1 hypothetical protein BXY80_2311 [Ichthyenterobacterium magnum]